MSAVLAGFIGIFLLATLCGFVIGRWSVRRRFVDVTHSYKTISKAAAGEVPWDMLWARFETVDVNTRLIVQEEIEARFPRKLPEQ